MESEGAGQIDTPDGQTITLRTHGRQSIAGKLGVAFNTSAETMMRRPLNRVKESEETNANKPLLNNFKPKSHRERKETIRVFQVRVRVDPVSGWAVGPSEPNERERFVERTVL